MRTLLALFPLFLLLSCGSGTPPPAATSARTHAGWSDDTLWAVLEAQDHRDTRALLHFLGHKRPEVRERAAFAFASAPDSAARAPLITALKDSVPAVRAAVAVAMGNANDSLLWSALQRASDIERDTVVLRVMLEQAFKARTDLKLKGKPEDLFQLLGTGNASIRLRAAQQLVRRPSDEMAALEQPMLEAARTEHDPDVRMFLVAALKHFRSSKVNVALTEWGARDSMAMIRVSALRALGAQMNDSLANYFLDRMNDGSQAVRLTAVEQLERMKGPLNAEEIWKIAQVQGDAFTQIPLYGLVLKHGGEGERLIARKLLEAQATLENMAYAEAGIVRALANDPQVDIGALEKIMTTAPSAVERTTALEAVLGALQERAKVVGVAQAVLNGHVMDEALSSGDAGLIALACERLAEWEPKDLQQVLDPELTDKARSALHPIRDLEALQDLDIAIAKRDGKPPPAHQAPAFNHPIDRQRLLALKDGQRYRIKTTKGDIVIALEPMVAPGTCVAFDSLVTAGFYNGKFFHRVVANFVAQGGCPRGDGYGSMDWTLRTEVGYEGFTTGAIGVASAGHDTESCQFFIMTAPAPHLDGRYTRFAHVVEGQDVADVLAIGDLITAVQKVE